MPGKVLPNLVELAQLSTIHYVTLAVIVLGSIIRESQELQSFLGIPEK